MPTARHQSRPLTSASLAQFGVIILFLFSALGLLYAVFGPALVAPVSHHVSDLFYEIILKSIHIVIFGGWAFGWALVIRLAMPRMSGLLLAWLAPLVLAIAAEAVQVWLPGHRPTVGGALASVGGVAAGVLLAFHLCRRAMLSRRESRWNTA